MYKSITELNHNQLSQLKIAYLYDVENDYSSTDEIPNEIIIKHYSEISFVNLEVLK